MHAALDIALAAPEARHRRHLMYEAEWLVNRAKKVADFKDRRAGKRRENSASPAVRASAAARRQA